VCVFMCVSYSLCVEEAEEGDVAVDVCVDVCVSMCVLFFVYRGGRG
jgi:hypothetical protein